jgi:hypothetical protein
MRWRKFIAGYAAARSAMAREQQPERVRRVGVMMWGGPNPYFDISGQSAQLRCFEIGNTEPLIPGSVLCQADHTPLASQGE